MTLQQTLAIYIQNILLELYEYEVEIDGTLIQKTKKEFEGDYTFVVFPYVKAIRKSPDRIAAEIGEKLTEKYPDFIKNFNVIKGFLNIALQNVIWLNEIYGKMNEPPRYARNDGRKSSSKFERADGESRRSSLCMIEYSSPNTNKPLHLGHIRNNLLGNAVANILEACEKQVVRVNLVNDRGIHICKSMLAWQKFGNNETPESTGMKGDKLVGKYYVIFAKEWRNQYKRKSKNIRENFCNCPNFKTLGSKTIRLIAKKTYFFFYNYDIEKTPNYKIAIRAFINTNINSRWVHIKLDLENNLINWFESTLLYKAGILLRKWERGDPKTRQLWEKLNGWVYKGFDETYKRLDIKFDKTYYESDTYLLGKQIIKEGLKSDAFYQKPDGSVWVDLSDEGLDEKLLLRSDGTSVYITQDLGTAQLRYNEYHPEKMIYVVGNEQNYHFDVLKIILAKKLHENFGKHIEHLSYGMVELPFGKMKSREGTVVDADDLMEAMFQEAKSTSETLGKFNFEEKEAAALYEMLGLGALKYFILKVDPKKNMLFNPEESIDFNGNTAPFIQYTHARIKSLLRKAEESTIMYKKVSFPVDFIFGEPEKELVKLLYDYETILINAAETLNPALIANYTFELAKEFNRFYQEIPVFKEKNALNRALRLQIAENCAEIIKKAMKLLGIEVPERM